MLEKRFQEIKAKIEAQVATQEEILELVRNADLLRTEYVEFMNENDDWDKDHPAMGYNAYGLADYDENSDEEKCPIQEENSKLMTKRFRRLY